MIYLLSQIVLALLLAAVVGGALGWLLHRTTQVREAGQLRNAIQRQRQQVAQLNSEIAMLTDDYDELQRQSHDEITELREANQQIPRLNSNLEKSQLLVAQMIKRHESQIRDLNTQNQTLTQKLKELEAQEQTLRRQQADLDSARRELGFADSPVTTTDDGADAAIDDASEIEESSDPSEVIANSDVDADAGDESSADVEAVSEAEEDSDDDAEANAEADSEAVAVSGDAAESDAEADSDSGTDAPTEKHTPAPQAVITSSRNVSSWASAPLLIEEATNTADLAADASDASDADADADADADDSVSADADTASSETTPLPEPSLEKSSVIFLNADAPLRDDETSSIKSSDSTADADDSDVDPFDQVIEVDDQLLEEIDSDLDEDEFLNSLDEAVARQTPDDDDSSSFEPVEQQDDLQRIGGIGPSTEKALNELGITSYAQLAKLKHHEIETIANALQIVPDRIERDDWVGNARRQLEDVLEQL